jgi:hypothetical protein
LTLDGLTFSQYLKLLRYRGRGHDADELQESIPHTLETTYEAVSEMTWGLIQEELEAVIQDLKAQAVAPFLFGQGDEEVFVGGALPPEQAAKVLAGQNADWAAFKAKTESSIRG